jgi:hypothetical protein
LLGVAVPDPLVSLEGRNVQVDTEAETKRNNEFANTIGKEIFGQKADWRTTQHDAAGQAMRRWHSTLDG